MADAILSNYDASGVEDYFRLLGVSPQCTVGMNYDKLSKLITKSYHNLSLTCHPDKTVKDNKSDRERKELMFRNANIAYMVLKNYIAPLEKGLPCDHKFLKKKDDRLTLQEFKYWEKIFREFNFTKEQIVGKEYNELYPLLQKNNKFKTDLECLNKHWENLERCSVSLDEPFADSIKLLKLLKESTVHTYLYIDGLKSKRSLIYLDKQILSLELLWVKYRSCFTKIHSYIYCVLLTNAVVFFYGSWSLVGINILSHTLLIGFVCGIGYNLVQSVRNCNALESKSGIGKLGKVWNFYYYSLIILGTSLLIHHFIVYGLTIGSIVLGLLFFENVARMIYNHLYDIGCCIYVSRKCDDLYFNLSVVSLLDRTMQETTQYKECLIHCIEEMIKLYERQKKEADPMYRVTEDGDYVKCAESLLNFLEDLCPLDANLLHYEPLKSYDPRRLLMPLIMPAVQRSFKDFEDMLDKRNFATISTDISDIGVPQNLLSIMPSQSHAC